jgi:hypothetical protein
MHAVCTDSRRPFPGAGHLMSITSRGPRQDVYNFARPHPTALRRPREGQVIYTILRLTDSSIFLFLSPRVSSPPCLTVWGEAATYTLSN